MFHKTSTKLAGLYLAAMMVISLFFSINVYQLSVQEFDRGFRGQGSILQRGPDFHSAPITLDQLLHDQQDRYSEAKARVLNRLIFINLIILIGGGFLSYYLARRTIKPIEEAHQALERFTADASHELRTPIAAMQTETEVALMNPKLTLTHARNQLKSNLEELAKLTSLSEGLLRLAQTKNNDLRRSKVDIESMIHKSVSQVLPLAEKKRILIDNQIQVGLKVAGDEASLIEVLTILLDNAIKYSPEKTQINIMARQQDDVIVIHIKDSGIGIRATELPHIFDRFYRADSSRSKHTAGGYGLGLAIAKNIIELHKGTINVKSKMGEGSMFTVQMPAVI